jgi:hypothetical protein
MTLSHSSTTLACIKIRLHRDAFQSAARKPSCRVKLSSLQLECLYWYTSCTVPAMRRPCANDSFELLKH